MKTNQTWYRVEYGVFQRKFPAFVLDDGQNAVFVRKIQGEVEGVSPVGRFESYAGVPFQQDLDDTRMSSLAREVKGTHLLWNLFAKFGNFVLY